MRAGADTIHKLRCKLCFPGFVEPRFRTVGNEACALEGDSSRVGDLVRLDRVAKESALVVRDAYGEQRVFAQDVRVTGLFAFEIESAVVILTEFYIG